MLLWHNNIQSFEYLLICMILVAIVYTLKICVILFQHNQNSAFNGMLYYIFYGGYTVIN